MKIGIPAAAALAAVLAACIEPASAQRCRYPYGRPATRVVGHTTNPLLGETAPPFQLKLLDGTTHTLAEYRDERNFNRVVVLHFTNPGIAACDDAAARLQSLAEGMNSREVVVLAVVSGMADDPVAAAQRFRTQHNISFPVLLDDEGTAAAAYAVTTYPTTFIIDPGEKVCFIQAGGFNGGTIDRAVRRFRRLF